METPFQFPKGAAPLVSNGRTGNEHRQRTPKLVPPAHHAAPRRTSEVTARQIAKHSGAQRDRVFAAILSHGSVGPTDDEGEAALGPRPKSNTPRRGELVKLGLVMDSRQRRATTSGLPAAVWIAREHAESSAPTTEGVSQ